MFCGAVRRPAEPAVGIRSAARSTPTKSARVAMVPPSSLSLSRTGNGAVGVARKRISYRTGPERLRAHVDRRPERKDAREPSHCRVPQADATVADARPDQPRLVRPVQADAPVTARERLQH